MSNAVLISIHPKYVASILSGMKVFEYRKVMPTQDVSHLVLYCTAPIKKVVAIAEVVRRLVEVPSRIWKATVCGSGITHRFYRDYFSGCSKAGAFELGKVYELSTPLELSKLTSCKVAPQSFCYLNACDTNYILKKAKPIPAVPPSLIFVGGIHGVGKTKICQNAFSPFGYRCMTASSLIASNGRITDKNKRVDDVPGNQSALIEQLAVERQRHCRLLIDGHFTLINSQEQIDPIEHGFFQSINPDHLILIKGDPKVITMNLYKRDRINFDPSFIAKFQELEENNAKIISQQCGKKLLVISNEETPKHMKKSFKQIIYDLSST